MAVDPGVPASRGESGLQMGSIWLHGIRLESVNLNYA